MHCQPVKYRQWQASTAACHSRRPNLVGLSILYTVHGFHLLILSCIWMWWTSESHCSTNPSVKVERANKFENGAAIALLDDNNSNNNNNNTFNFKKINNAVIYNFQIAFVNPWIISLFINRLIDGIYSFLSPVFNHAVAFSLKQSLWPLCSCINKGLKAFWCKCGLMAVYSRKTSWIVPPELPAGSLRVFGTA